MDIKEKIIEQAKSLGLAVDKRKDGYMIFGVMNIKSDYMSDEVKDYGSSKIRIGLGDIDAYFSVSLDGHVFSTSYSFEEILSILKTGIVKTDEQNEQVAKKD